MVESEDETGGGTRDVHEANVLGTEGTIRMRGRAMAGQLWRALTRVGSLLVIAGVLLAVVVIGLGVVLVALAAGGTTVKPPTTASGAHLAAGSPTTGHAQPTSTPLLTAGKPVPTAVISFGYGVPAQAASGSTTGGIYTFTQHCQPGHPLDPLLVTLDNSGTISVDWSVDIQDKAPDGKTLWGSGLPPYGTLPAGQSQTLKLNPDPGLCTQLAGKTAPATYHAMVTYAGVSGFELADTITPGPAAPASTSTTTPPHP